MSASNDPDPKLRLDASVSGKPVWYQDMRFISVLLVVVGLLALPLVWINRTLTLQKKILITVISVVIAAVLFVASGWLLKTIQQETDSTQLNREAVFGSVTKPGDIAPAAKS